MSKPVKRWFCLTLLLLLLANPLLAYAGRIVRVGLFDFKPLIFRNDRGEPSGLFIDVLNHVAANEEWQLKY